MVYEQPPCEDGQGENFLDLACTLYGLGIVLPDLTPEESSRDEVQAA